MMHNLAVVTSAISSVQMIRVRRYFDLIIVAVRGVVRCPPADRISTYLELQCWCWWCGCSVTSQVQPGHVITLSP